MRRTLYALFISSLLWQVGFQVKAQPVVYENKVFEGSSFEKIILTSANNGSRFINCTFRNITLSSGGVVMIDGADDVVFDGCTFENIKGSDYKDVHAIVSGTRGTNIVIRNSKFKSIAADGIQAGNQGEDIRNWEIYNNEFIDCRENGIDLKRVHGNFVIRNNYFAETKFCDKGGDLGCTGGGGSAITIHMGSKGITIDGNKFYKNGNGVTVSVGPDPAEYGYPDNTVISNNLIYESVEYGIRIRFAENTKVYNNTIVNSSLGNFRIELESGQSVDARNNLMVGSDKYTQDLLNDFGNGYGNLLFDDISKAGFVNPGAYDYHLKSSSAAVDAGVNISSLSTDFEGDKRVMGSACDVGGDEHGSATITPSNVSPEVAIVSPNNNSSYEVGNKFTVTASAKDQDGSIVSVKFYNGSTLLAEDKTSPYTHEISPEVASAYKLTAVAEDNEGATTTSSMVNVTINDTEETDVPETPAPPTEDISSNGLQYEYFEGQWTSLPNFSSLTANKKGTTSNFLLHERNRSEYFAFLFTGFIKIEESGNYTFYTSSDDGSQLFIGSDKVVDNDGRHALVEKSGQVYLTEGLHPIKVSFFDYKGKENLQVKYAGPGFSKKDIPDHVLFTEEAAAEPENLAPEVVITNPDEYSTVEVGTSFTVIASAKDQDGSVVSVKFYNGNTLLAEDKTSPYTHEIQATEVGEYNLTTVAEDDKGATSTSSTVKVVVVEKEETDTPTQDGISFTLINADTDQPINGFNPLENGDLIDLAQVGTSLNIVVGLNGISDVAKVSFDYNDERNYQNERQAPYSLEGDNKGDFLSWTPDLGTNTVTATVYSKSGSVVATATIKFQVVNNTNARMSVDKLNVKTYPNPAVNELHVTAESTEETMDTQLEYRLIDNSGSTVRIGTIRDGNQITSVDVQDLGSGIYILQVLTKDGITTKKIFINKN